MKSIILTLLTALMIMGSVNSQDIKNDSLLLKVVEELPANWKAAITDSIFTIEYKDSTWVMPGNWINAPESAWKLKNDSSWIIANGQMVKMKFSFQLKNKMTKEEIKQLKESSDNYRGRWAWVVYNSQHYTLHQLSLPEMDDEFNAIWPKKTGAWKVRSILRKHLSVD